VNIRDTKQINRKRHLSNDVVLILFDESNIPFNPQLISSNFNQVFFVVRKVSSNPTKYKIAVANKPGVGYHLPKLRSSQIYEKTEQFRDFFLTKLINAERACYLTSKFAKVDTLKRKGLLDEMKK